MQFKSILVFLSVLALSLSSCEKAPEKEPIKVFTGDAVDVGSNSAVLTGRAEVPDTPSGYIAIGVQYSLSEEMLPGSFTEINADTFTKDYSFSVEVNGLTPSTEYYFRTFAKESDVYSYGEIKSFTTTTLPPSVKLLTESASYNFLEHVGSFDVEITNPLSGCSLSAKSQSPWITDVVVNGGTVSYKVSENLSETDRTGSIKLSYDAWDGVFTITQTSVSLSLSPNSAETDYASKSLSFTCSIESPVDGLSLKASSESQWITDVKVSGNAVSYKVAENNSGASRIGMIKLAYGAATKEFSVTQTYSAPVITFTPTLQSTDYTSKTLSFTFSIGNPRDGMTTSVSTTETWITNVQVSGTAVSYKVAENTGIASRTGKFKITYGTVTKNFSVTQEQPMINGHDFVFLGLSVKWAGCNVGASNPEESGDYYQWSGVTAVTSTSIYLDWSNCPYHTGATNSTGWVKYIPSGKSSYWSGTGSPDNKTVLESGDDAASVEWKGSWRMPTKAEWDELRNTNNCSWTWTSINGVNGYKVQSKKPGYTNNWIFLPAAGYRIRDSRLAAGNGGHYWSSTLCTTDPIRAYSLSLVSIIDATMVVDDTRLYGYSVRAVAK